MRATNLLQPVANPRPAPATKPAIKPTTFDEQKAIVERKRNRLRFALSRAAVIIDEMERQAAVVDPEPSTPRLDEPRMLEPSGLVPPEPTRFPREPRVLTEAMARRAEFVHAQMQAAMQRDQERVEQMDAASFGEGIRAMRAAFAAYGIEDEAIFDRRRRGTFSRRKEFIELRYRVWSHMHYVGGIPFAEIGRMFACGHSTVMRCKSLGQGIAKKAQVG